MIRFNNDYSGGGGTRVCYGAFWLWVLNKMAGYGQDSHSQAAAAWIRRLCEDPGVCGTLYIGRHPNQSDGYQRCAAPSPVAYFAPRQAIFIRMKPARLKLPAMLYCRFPPPMAKITVSPN